MTSARKANLFLAAAEYLEDGAKDAARALREMAKLYQ